MMNVSLHYEIFMYLNSFYFGMFALCELSIGVLKAINLQYPEHVLLKESCILVGLCILEFVRIVLGRKGCLADHGWQVIASVFLTFPCVGGVLYLLLLQTYTLKLEYILCALLAALHGAELMFAVIFTISLCRPHEIT